MNLVFCILLSLIGIIMIIKPKIFWILGDSWKTNTKVEPSSLYIILLRIVGCLVFIADIFAILEVLGVL